MVVNNHFLWSWKCCLQVKDLVLSNSGLKGRKEGRKEMFYLTTHTTHFIYGYMVSDIWLRTILIVRKETRCRHIGYSFQLTARVLLYAPSHRQDSTYHSLCYSSHGALAGMRNTGLKKGRVSVNSKSVVLLLSTLKGTDHHGGIDLDIWSTVPPNK